MVGKIDTTEAKRRLLRLNELDPSDVSGVLGWLGEHLAARLSDRISPIGFVNEYYMTIFELRDGTERDTGKRIRNKLSGMHRGMVLLLQMSTPRVAGFIFPPEFAIEVFKEYEILQAEMRDRLA